MCLHPRMPRPRPQQLVLPVGLEVPDVGGPGALLEPFWAGRRGDAFDETCR